MTSCNVVLPNPSFIAHVCIIPISIFAESPICWFCHRFWYSVASSAQRIHWRHNGITEYLKGHFHNSMDSSKNNIAAIQCLFWSIVMVSLKSYILIAFHGCSLRMVIRRLRIPTCLMSANDSDGRTRSTLLEDDFQQLRNPVWYTTSYITLVSIYINVAAEHLE